MFLRNTLSACVTRAKPLSVVATLCPALRLADVQDLHSGVYPLLLQHLLFLTPDLNNDAMGSKRVLGLSCRPIAFADGS